MRRSARRFEGFSISNALLNIRGLIGQDGGCSGTTGCLAGGSSEGHDMHEVGIKSQPSRFPCIMH